VFSERGSVVPSRSQEEALGEAEGLNDAAQPALYGTGLQAQEVPISDESPVSPTSAMWTVAAGQFVR